MFILKILSKHFFEPFLSPLLIFNINDFLLKKTIIFQVWSLSVLRDDDFIVAGSNDAELRTWNISKLSIEDTEIKMSELLSSDTPFEFGVGVYFTKLCHTIYIYILLQK